MREANGHRTAVLVAADSGLARAGLEAVVREASAMLRLAGPAATLASVVREAAEREPDVVLLALDDDSHLDLISAISGRGASAPVRDGASATASTAPAVVALTEDALAREALEHGARSVLPLDSASEEIVAAVFAAAAGLVTLRPESAELIMENATRRTSVDAARSGSVDGFAEEALTPRELEVLSFVAEGAGNKEIAGRLRISEHTVKFHVASILSKLGAESRTEAVALGVRRGLILL